MTAPIFPHAAHTGSASRKRAYRLWSDPTDPKHGTATGYCYGCRCEACLDAGRAKNREAMRQRRLNAKRNAAPAVAA